MSLCTHREIMKSCGPHWGLKQWPLGYQSSTLSIGPWNQLLLLGEKCLYNHWECIFHQVTAETSSGEIGTKKFSSQTSSHSEKVSVRIAFRIQKNFQFVLHFAFRKFFSSQWLCIIQKNVSPHRHPRCGFKPITQGKNFQTAVSPLIFEIEKKL